MSKPLIVIPARMSSKRFPGKPLAEISGISMLRRTARVAENVHGTDYVIATDHHDIESHCKAFSLPVVMTKGNFSSGSDRSLAAANKFAPARDLIVNLQGDAPFADPSHIDAVLRRLGTCNADIATPAVQLSWANLRAFRSSKKLTPFSGTTVVECQGRAIWFSKKIIPAMRQEPSLKDVKPLSPVLRHIGLYGFKRSALERFTSLPPSQYEVFEGLEQLRALEAGMHIEVVRVSPPLISSPGIDTPDDLLKAEILIEKFGDPFIS